jgi:hypothetical protein
MGSGQAGKLYLEAEQCEHRVVFRKAQGLAVGPKADISQRAGK